MLRGAFLHSDHLGSTSLTLDASGAKIGEMKYTPFGETRYTWGGTPTDRRFTGQREETGLGSLYDFNARMYSPGIMRFISADTIVPDPKNPQTLNRYAYALNSPLNHTDPSGHCVPDEDNPKICRTVKPDGFKFFKLPVAAEDFDWTQWYGTTEFAYEHRGKYDYSQEIHAGIDLGAVAGTNVYAGVYGTVMSPNPAFGPANVRIEVSAYGSVYHIIYGHLASDSVTLKVGDKVTPDTNIGVIGVVKGQDDHLHLEVRSADPDEKYMYNPLRFMNWEDLQIVKAVAVTQVDGAGNPNKSVRFHKPTETETHLTYYGDPWFQPVIRHWGGSYWDN